MKYFLISFLFILGTNLNATEFLIYDRNKTLMEQLEEYENFEIPDFDFIVWDTSTTYTRDIEKFKPIKVGEKILKIVYNESKELQNVDDNEENLATEEGFELEFAIIDLVTKEVLASATTVGELEDFLKKM